MKQIAKLSQDAGAELSYQCTAPSVVSEHRGTVVREHYCRCLCCTAGCLYRLQSLVVLGLDGEVCPRRTMGWFLMHPTSRIINQIASANGSNVVDSLYVVRGCWRVVYEALASALSDPEIDQACARIQCGPRAAANRHFLSSHYRLACTRIRSFRTSH